MSNIYTSVDQLVGHTPLLELTHIEKQLDLKAKILAKLEYFNPAGSVKDRIAKAMIEDAEASGALKPDAVIIEPTPLARPALPPSPPASSNASRIASLPCSQPPAPPIAGTAPGADSSTSPAPPPWKICSACLRIAPASAKFSSPEATRLSSPTTRSCVG